MFDLLEMCVVSLLTGGCLWKVCAIKMVGCHSGDVGEMREQRFWR